MASKSPPTEKELTKDNTDTSPNPGRSTRIKRRNVDNEKKPASKVTAKSTAVTVARAARPAQKYPLPSSRRRVLNKKGDFV